MARGPEPARRHKRIRLDARLYAQVGAVCSVTVAVRQRQPIFANLTLAEGAVQILRERATATGVEVYAYCVMPDHIHLLLAASPLCDIPMFVGQFKNLVQRFAWLSGVQGTFWQRSFWDHFLRADEDLEQVLAYVLNNPVRYGLVEDRRDYPYSGSFVFEW